MRSCFSLQCVSSSTNSSNTVSSRAGSTYLAHRGPLETTSRSLPRRSQFLETSVSTYGTYAEKYRRCISGLRQHNPP
ncbi:hypothetical protein HanIR_Chr02g0085631 [Helianthus annuus]|nr:hypothetical protein HanIR_Chr02g0085631 [Helianthus annuus]